MRQFASSRSTRFWVLFGPLVFGIACGIPVLKLALDRQWIAAPFTLGLLLVGYYVFWLPPRLRNVSFDDDYVYVSDGREEIQVSWAEVAEIRPRFGAEWPTYILSFRHPTRYGDRVAFLLPKRGAFGFRTAVLEQMHELHQRHTAIVA